MTHHNDYYAASYTRNFGGQYLEPQGGAGMANDAYAASYTRNFGGQYLEPQTGGALPLPAGYNVAAGFFGAAMTVVLCAFVHAWQAPLLVRAWDKTTRPTDTKKAFWVEALVIVVSLALSAWFLWRGIGRTLEWGQLSSQADPMNSGGNIFTVIWDLGRNFFGFGPVTVTQ